MRSALLTSTALRDEDIAVLPKDPWTEYERYCGADIFVERGLGKSARIHPGRVSVDFETMDFSDAERRVLAYRVSP